MHRNVSPKTIYVKDGHVKLGGLEKLELIPFGSDLKNTLIGFPMVLAPE